MIGRSGASRGIGRPAAPLWPFTLPASGHIGPISSNVLTDITPTGGAVIKADEDFSLPKVLGAWGNAALVHVYSGVALTDILYVIFGGGHGDTGNDATYGWSARTGLMYCLVPPTTVTPSVVTDTTHGENINGRPASQHPYTHTQGLDSNESNGPALMQLVGAGVGSSAIACGQAHRLDTSALTWARFGDVGPVSSTTVQAVIKDAARQKFIRFPSDSGTAFYTLDYSVGSPTWQTLAQTARTGSWTDTHEACGIKDPVRDLYLCGNQRGAGLEWRAIDAANPTGAWTELTFTGDAIPTTYGTGLMYRPLDGTFLLMDTSSEPPTGLFVITPPASSPLSNAWSVVRRSFTGTSHFNNYATGNEWMNRWQYEPSLDSVIVCPDSDFPMEAWRL